MASLHKLPSGTFRVMWREAGKQHALAVENRQLAEVELRRIEARESAAKSIRAATAMDLLEVIGRWERAKIGDGKDPEHIAEAALRARRLVETHGWKRTDDVTPVAAEAWRATGSPRTGAILRSILRWSWVVLDQPIHDRALALLSPGSRSRRPPRPLITAKQVADFEAKAALHSPGCRALVHCLATYGWRPITAARLLVGDVDLKAGTITTRVKGGDTVRHPLLPTTLSLLGPLVQDRDPKAPLFTDPRWEGKPWAKTGRSLSIPEWFTNNLVNRRKDSTRIYDLKRYAITEMLRNGMRREQVVIFTGHRVLSQLDTYLVGNDRTQSEALSALKRVQQRVTKSKKRATGAKSKTINFPVKSAKAH